MTNILAGLIGGLLVLVAAALGVVIWWHVEDRRTDRVLANLNHLS